MRGTLKFLAKAIEIFGIFWDIERRVLQETEDLQFLKVFLKIWIEIYNSWKCSLKIWLEIYNYWKCSLKIWLEIYNSWKFSFKSE
jgi:hypothetical protein